MILLQRRTHSKSFFSHNTNGIFCALASPTLSDAFAPSRSQSSSLVSPRLSARNCELASQRASFTLIFSRFSRKLRCQMLPPIVALALLGRSASPSPTSERRVFRSCAEKSIFLHANIFIIKHKIYTQPNEKRAVGKKTILTTKSALCDCSAANKTFTRSYFCVVFTFVILVT